MKDFSPSYLDKLANRLEEMSGDTRSFGEDADSRILTSLEAMGNITTPNGDYQQRVCDAVNNINVGGGGGGTNLGIGNFNANGIYNASDFSLDGFNQVNIQVPSGGVTTISPFYDPMYGNVGQTLQICFNEPVELSNEINSCSGTFYYFRAFNQPVSIPNSVTECISMFDSCYSFNQPITIPNLVTNCAYMFSDCSTFNQPITVPESVTNIAGMFSGCANMNSLVRLPEKFNNGTTTAFWDNCPVSVANDTLEFY